MSIQQPLENPWLDSPSPSTPPIENCELKHFIIRSPTTRTGGRYPYRRDEEHPYRQYYFELRGKGGPPADSGYPGDVYLDISGPIVVYIRHQMKWLAWNLSHSDTAELLLTPPIHPFIANRYLWWRNDGNSEGLYWFSSEGLRRHDILSSKCYKATLLTNQIRQHISATKSQVGTGELTLGMSSGARMNRHTTPAKRESESPESNKENFIDLTLSPVRQASPLTYPGRITSRRSQKKNLSEGSRSTSGIYTGRHGKRKDVTIHGPFRRFSPYCGPIPSIEDMKEACDIHLAELDCCKAEKDALTAKNMILESYKSKYLAMKNKYDNLKAKWIDIANIVETGKEMSVPETSSST